MVALTPAARMQFVLESLATQVRVKVVRGRGQRRNRRNRPVLVPLMTPEQARRVLEAR